MYSYGSITTNLERKKNSQDLITILSHHLTIYMLMKIKNIILLPGVLQLCSDHLELKILHSFSDITHGGDPQVRGSINCDLGCVGQHPAWLPSLCYGSMVMEVLHSLFRAISHPPGEVLAQMHPHREHIPGLHRVLSVSSPLLHVPIHKLLKSPFPVRQMTKTSVKFWFTLTIPRLATWFKNVRQYID